MTAAPPSAVIDRGYRGDCGHSPGRIPVFLPLISLNGFPSANPQSTPPNPLDACRFHVRLHGAMTPRFQNLDRLHLPPRPFDVREHLQRILEALVNEYGAEKIIAFGSCVRGDVTEHSDVDLCVIREHPPECTHPGLEADLCLSRAHARLAADVLVRTPRQWEDAQRRPFGVMDEAIHHGLPLFEK